MITQGHAIGHNGHNIDKRIMLTPHIKNAVGIARRFSNHNMCSQCEGSAMVRLIYGVSFLDGKNAILLCMKKREAGQILFL